MVYSSANRYLARETLQIPKGEKYFPGTGPEK
jgi:hypothetical protein